MSDFIVPDFLGSEASALGVSASASAAISSRVRSVTTEVLKSFIPLSGLTNLSFSLIRSQFLSSSPGFGLILIRAQRP